VELTGLKFGCWSTHDRSRAVHNSGGCGVATSSVDRPVPGTRRRCGRSARSAELRRAARRAHQQAGFEPAAVHALYLRTQQSPNRNSRVSLTGHRDRLGLPQLQLDWQLTHQDTASIDGWLDQLNQVLEQRLGQVIRPAAGWQRGIIGGPHDMGTTRMAADPRHGVVDADGRVHWVANLFVAGSSVFSTGGYANPTFTLLALAIRLADRVRSELQSTATVEP
jgi:choline dehydrogenase-like flavoprotein